MKKRLILIAVLFICFSNFADAQTEPDLPSPTPTEVQEIKDELKNKINDLKERLATRVAEIREQNKRAFFGIVKEKDEVSLILENNERKTTVAYDDETTIEQNINGKISQTETSNLKVGANSVAFGILDIDQKTLVAKKIIIKTAPLFSVGKVAETDTNKGALSIKEPNGSSSSFDYEIKTKCLLWVTGTQKLTSCGLSKIKVGDFAVIRGEANKDNSFTILRILVVPQPAESKTE